MGTPEAQTLIALDSKNVLTYWYRGVQYFSILYCVVVGQMPRFYCGRFGGIDSSRFRWGRRCKYTTPHPLYHCATNHHNLTKILPNLVKIKSKLKTEERFPQNQHPEQLLDCMYIIKFYLFSFLTIHYL